MSPRALYAAAALATLAALLLAMWASNALTGFIGGLAAGIARG